MKLDYALRLVSELRLFADANCRKRSRSGYYLRQTFFPRETKKELARGEAVADITTTRTTRTIWVRLDKLVSTQSCLGRPRLTYQLRRHPFKRRPTVIALSRGRYLLWDGNHRATAAAMLGLTRLRVDELRKSRVKRPRK